MGLASYVPATLKITYITYKIIASITVISQTKMVVTDTTSDKNEHSSLLPVECFCVLFTQVSKRSMMDLEKQKEMREKYKLTS